MNGGKLAVSFRTIIPADICEVGLLPAVNPIASNEDGLNAMGKQAGRRMSGSSPGDFPLSARDAGPGRSTAENGDAPTRRRADGGREYSPSFGKLRRARDTTPAVCYYFC